MTTIAELCADPVAHYPFATAACLDPVRGDLPRRRLDHARNVAYLERLVQAGAPALLIAASTGQGHLRTVEELAEWFRSAAEANLGDAWRLALLRPEDGLEANRRLLEVLSDLPYPVVFFRPGVDLAPLASAASAGPGQAAQIDNAVVAQLAPLVRLAADMGFAVGLYSISNVSGVPLSAEAARRLALGPGGECLVAVKVTELDYDASTRAYLEHPDLKRVKIVQGWDPHIARALREGPLADARGRQRCGVTSGPMSLATHQYTHLLAAAGRGEWEEVAAAQGALSNLFAAMQDDPRKFADLQRAKYLMGLGHAIDRDITPEQVERVLRALQELPRAADRARLARSLNLMGDGPYAARLAALGAS